MALPAQVKKQMDEIEQYEKALAEQAASEPTVQTETPKPTAETTEVAPVTEAVTPEPEVATNVVELKPAQDAEEMTWKQRYKTLDGMIEAENRRNKELHAQLQQLQAEVTTLKSVPKAEEPVKLVSDEEVENFGADLIDVQRRIAKEVATSFQTQMDELKAENVRLQAMIGQTGSQVANLSFEQKLQMTVPDFESLNANPKWVAWLDEVDPILRGPRRTVAQAAYERGDVGALKHYTDLFKSAVKPAVTTVNTAAEELRQQVAPSRTTTVTSSQPQEKTYTEQEAGKLFDRVGLLYRQGKNDEASKLEAELTDAYTTGRVR